jgi:hypothetical protein
MVHSRLIGQVTFFLCRSGQGAGWAAGKARPAWAGAGIAGAAGWGAEFGPDIVREMRTSAGRGNRIVFQVFFNRIGKPNASPSCHDNDDTDQYLFQSGFRISITLPI